MLPRRTKLRFQDLQVLDYFNQNDQKQVFVQQFAFAGDSVAALDPHGSSLGPHLPILRHEDQSPGSIKHRGIDNGEAEVTVWMPHLTKEGERLRGV